MGGRQEAQDRRRTQGYRRPSPGKGLCAVGRDDRGEVGQRPRAERGAPQEIRRPSLSRSASEGSGNPDGAQGTRADSPPRASPTLGHRTVPPSSSAHSMGTRISRRGTTVLVLTSDAGLIRLVRSILEPACTVIGRTPLGANADIRTEQTDVVIIDAESVDHDVISAARRVCPNARVIALAREFREADCVAILDAGADYLARPFRAQDLAARVRVAELRRFNLTGRPRTYRKGLLVFELFDRRLAIDGRAGALRP